MLNMMWFKSDLRILDNPALHAAMLRGPTIAVYYVSEKQWQKHALSPAKKSLIIQQLNAAKDKKEFEILVVKESSEFYYKLDKMFPDLSEKNKKLCSLLLLNLTSKEIATLLNISPASVEKSRHRLRKKMDLNAEVNISEFLNNLG